MQRLATAEGEAQLIERHFELTGREHTEEILNNWDEAKDKFWQVYPPAEANTPMVEQQEMIVAGIELPLSAAMFASLLLTFPHNRPHDAPIRLSTPKETAIILGTA